MKNVSFVSAGRSSASLIIGFHTKTFLALVPRVRSRKRVKVKTVVTRDDLTRASMQVS